MKRLNKIFESGNVLYAEEMNDIVESINDIDIEKMNYLSQKELDALCPAFNAKKEEGI